MGELIVLVLPLFWVLESVFPFTLKKGGWRRELKNLLIGAPDILVAVLFVYLIASHLLPLVPRFGLLHHVQGWLHWPLLVLLFDVWMYTWHRLNHHVPFLWRFHKLHHRDEHLSSTTSVRFHVVEIFFSACTRLLVLPLLGMTLAELAVYELILFPVIVFHHSNIALPLGLDKALAWLISTPGWHRVHHSAYQPETDSNFSSVLTIWDRLFGTARYRKDQRAIVYGLRE